MKKANKFLIICCSLLFSSCSASKNDTGKCIEHTGKEVCSVCGINYFETTCNYLKTLEYNASDDCYSDTISTYTDGNKTAFKISYYPQSNFICLEVTDVALYTSLYARLYFYDAAGDYEYRVVRTTGGMLTGKIEAKKFSADISTVNYDYCSFYGTEKYQAIQYAITRLDTCVKSFGTILKTQNLFVRDFGFDNYQ